MLRYLFLWGFDLAWDGVPAFHSCPFNGKNWNPSCAGASPSSAFRTPPHIDETFLALGASPSSAFRTPPHIDEPHMAPTCLVHEVPWASHNRCTARFWGLVQPGELAYPVGRPPCWRSNLSSLSCCGQFSGLNLTTFSNAREAWCKTIRRPGGVNKELKHTRADYRHPPETNIHPLTPPPDPPNKKRLSMCSEL